MSNYEKVRTRMIQEQLLPRGITDPAVLKAIEQTPRHLFIQGALHAQAYGDFPLPIGHGQTISQPYVVALMTQLLELKGHEKILEIGTGCGYQSAILSALCDKVYTVERIKPLLAKTRRIFDRLHKFNIVSKIDDGTEGWPEHAPFDAIIVTAAGPQVPQPLIDQLADPGIMVLPVGETSDDQTLTMVRKKDGEVTITPIENVRFVKLVGTHGWTPQ
ncbi:MAG: protein-L-isoaspartate(D-aspartate) O-methyltransferase [Desulfobulbaceae bacterium]|nr:protein-L-isoaspartate(D-aspartate) O-methyltransferase [Desulfobulbaceae bacterium]HIJ79594.1 protein-L-isoaspartate(D-aspartate) O-methyltransferase [Deltaproteobacteria bacterium]